MTSTISSARVSLFHLLTEELFDVQVTYGPPGAYEEHEVVALMGVFDVDDSAPNMGGKRSQENYRLEVGIKVHNPAASDAQSVDERGWELYDRFRAAVKGNLTLDETVRTAWPVGVPQTDGAVPAEGGGWVMFIRTFVECTARID